MKYYHIWYDNHGWFSKVVTTDLGEALERAKNYGFEATIYMSSSDKRIDLQNDEYMKVASFNLVSGVNYNYIRCKC